MYQKIHIYGTSFYPSVSPINASNNRKKKVRVMKDDLGGVSMKEFVAFRPKMYSFVNEERQRNQ